MKKVIERIVESSGAPKENDLWLNGTTLKKFQNGEWVALSVGGSDSDSDYFAPMVVKGTLNGNDFTPVEASPTWADARAHMFAGGLVYLSPLYNGEPFGVFLATFASDSSSSIGAPSDEGFMFWVNAV